MTVQQPAPSPLLASCPPSLPAHYYYDATHFELEQKSVQRRCWINAGRVNDIAPMSVKKIEVAGQNLILVRNQDGEVACFYNTCRHRGAELCAADGKLSSRLITCRYHQWSYDLAGNLVRVPFATPTEDFKKSDHGLLPVATHVWNSFIFICLAENPPPFETVPDLGVNALDNWPMADLVCGHTATKQVSCNWKIFWENYNECLHCPGIHPMLCDMVPVYKRGIMAANEDPAWSPSAEQEPVLKPGAQTWTMNGKPCGPEFENLNAAQRAAGMTFVTLLPTMFIVAHVDYVRTVTVTPVSPEVTELKAQWLFPETTLRAPGFDLANVVDFASTVLVEDAEACEMNQKGLRAARFSAGTLMPQEFDIWRFHQWLRRQLENA